MSETQVQILRNEPRLGTYLPRSASSNAQQEPGGGNGICQDIFQLILDFVTAILPASKAAKYQCLLDALCTYTSLSFPCFTSRQS